MHSCARPNYHLQAASAALLVELARSSSLATPQAASLPHLGARAFSQDSRPADRNSLLSPPSLYRRPERENSSGIHQCQLPSSTRFPAIHNLSSSTSSIQHQQVILNVDPKDTFPGIIREFKLPHFWLVIVHRCSVRPTRRPLLQINHAAEETGSDRRQNHSSAQMGAAAARLRSRCPHPSANPFE
jgi:hypothetical protein